MSPGPNDNENGAKGRSRTANSTSSSAEHRKRLEALFGDSNVSNDNGGTASASAAPAPKAEKVFSSPRKSTGRAPTDYRLRLERLRMAREEDEIRDAANVFLSHHQLPDDLDILFKLLKHPDEKVVRDALGQISSLLMQGRLSSVMLLKEHLNTLAQRVKEDATRSFIEGVRAQVDSQE